MSGIKGLFKRFSQECETSDQQADEQLQTRYYKSSLDKVFDAVEAYYKSGEYTITSYSKEHGELIVQRTSRPKMFIIATVITVRPFQTSVDLKVSTEQPSVTAPYSSLKKEIVSTYAALDRQLKRAER